MASTVGHGLGVYVFIGRHRDAIRADRLGNVLQRLNAQVFSHKADTDAAPRFVADDDMAAIAEGGKTRCKVCRRAGRRIGPSGARGAFDLGL
jgi:hypothetical protein